MSIDGEPVVFIFKRAAMSLTIRQNKTGAIGAILWNPASRRLGGLANGSMVAYASPMEPGACRLEHPGGHTKACLWIGNSAFDLEPAEFRELHLSLGRLGIREASTLGSELSSRTTSPTSESP